MLERLATVEMRGGILEMGSRYALAVLAWLALAGCHAGFALRGTVTEGTQAGHRFEKQPNPDGAEPVAGASLALYVSAHPIECVEGGARDADGNPRSPEASSMTGADGSFEFPSFTLLGGPFSDDWIGLCVEHAGHARYGMNELWGAGSPKRFAGYVNIRLVAASPKPAGHDLGGQAVSTGRASASCDWNTVGALELAEAEAAVRQCDPDAQIDLYLRWRRTVPPNRELADAVASSGEPMARAIVARLERGRTLRDETEVGPIIFLLTWMDARGYYRASQNEDLVARTRAVVERMKDAQLREYARKSLELLMQRVADDQTAAGAEAP